jgi:hypothetical protein
MRQTTLLVATWMALSCAAICQVPKKEIFPIRILKIKRVHDACSVEAQSPTVRIVLSSDIPAGCTMLRAGETYNAFRAEVEMDPKDQSKDAAILVIYNNTSNVRRENAVYNIDSEEANSQGH